MLNPRSQEASTTPPRLRFNFTRAKEAGASDEQILDFLRAKDTNIDWDALQERASKQQNPLAYQVATLAQNDWSFSQPPTPTHNPQAQNAQTTTPQATEQNLASQPSGFSTTQSNKLAALEQENGGRSFWRQFAPEFLQSQSMQQDTKFLEDSTAQAIRDNTPYDNLPKALQDHIASQPQEQSFGDDLATNLAPLAIAQQIHKLTNKSERAKHHYETQQKSLAIAQKEVETLSDEDKEFIKSQASAWDKLWDSDEELYHDFIQTQRASKVVPQEMKHSLEVLSNIHGHKDFFTLGSKLLGGEENKELKQDYLNAAHTIATNLGFDGIGTNEKGELYINHEGKYYRVESGFWESVPTILAANTGSIAGSIAGAAQGARYGRALGGWGAVGGMALGGALGAAGGGALDVVFANAYLNRQTTAQEVIRHATQEGMLNLAADGVALGAIKLWGKAKNLKPKALGKLGSSVVEYTPILGLIKRAKDGNKAAAQKLLAQSYTPEQEAALKKASDEFGLALQVGSKQKLPTQDLPDPLANAIEKAQDIFTLQDQKQFQGKLLQAIRADESGNLLGFLAEAAAKSPKASQNLSQILHQTTLKLKRDLETISSKASVKGIFDELEKGTKDSYEEAMVKILGDIYDDTYKINLNTLKEASNSKSFESFKQQLADAGVAPETSANFLRFVESNIYNDKGVTFTQLNNALKNLNSYYKQASDPNFKTHIKAAFDNFIRTDIKAGIDAIFSQNKAAYNDAKALFETALVDYANMKDTLKLADKLRLRDRANTEQNALKSLLNFAKGQGDKQSNIDAITKALPQGERAHIEVAMLNELFSSATLEAKAVQVFDSAKFLNNVKELKGVFTSKAAQEYIAAASKFNELFKNDAQILQAIKPAITEKIDSSIATSIEGAAKFQVVKAIFANIIRLMPHIPLMPQLNQKVQGAALRHHLTNALESSYTISDLRLQLTQLEKRPSFNNATKELITKFKGEIDNTRDEILQAAKEQTPSHTTPSVQSTERLKTSEIKQELLQRLEPILNKPLTNAQGVQAYINHASIDKMLSDKAIAKSVENGFSKQEHLEAVGDIERLFSISQEAATHSHKGDNPSVIIHRLNAPFNNANALITTKESLDKDKNRIYSVELELTPRFNTPARPTDTEASKGSSSSLNGQGGQDSPTIAKADSSNSTTLSPLEQAQAQKQAKQEAQEAAQQAQRQADQATAQAIKDKNDQIQHLKDSRAGKSEMEREVKIGEPIAMKRTEQPPTSIATDDNNIYQLDFVIVKAHDVKPNFNADGLQPRTQKEHKTIESIAQNFKPEMVLGRGGYKDLPIIAKDGQVITGNHRVQGFKDFTPSSRAAYEKAIKDRFNIELASDELLLRTPSDDLSVKELLSIAYNSNKEDIKNLGDHIYSVLGRYAPNFEKLPRQLESSSVQELKSKIARILDNSPYPNENDANLALLANTIKADKNANITEMLNAFSKLDKEDADRTLSTFIDTAGLWHILSNNAVEYGLKQLDLRPFLLGAMYKSATSQHTTRAANFKELNAQIKHILDTTDASGSNMMLEIMPNTYDNLIADLLGASLARFMRLENPSANLYEALKGANSGIREQLAPRLDFETGFTTGRNIEQADIFDFIEYMIRQGDSGKEVNEAVELLPKLREKYEAFKGNTPPPSTPTPPTPPHTPKTTLESQAGKEASTEATEVIHKEAQEAPSTSTPAETPAQAQKVDSSEAPPSKINFTYTTGEAKGIAELRKDLKAALEPSLNKEIVNKETNITATISTKGLTKISSSKAVAKSVKNGFTRDEHFKVAGDLKNLFENSTLKESHADTKARDEIQAVHRFTKDLEINGSQAEAKITLFENNQAGNRIYSIELESLEKPTPLSPSATQTKAGAADLTQSVGGDANPTNIAKTDGEIIPQTQISNIKKQLVELKQSKSAYEKYLKSLERNMKDVELEERRYLRGEERIKVFERKRLIQSSIDEHTQDLNAVLKKMIELHKQLPENVRYTKEVLDDLTKIEAILKGNDYSLEQALILSKITQRLQEKAIIENESFLNKVYNLDDFAKGAKSLQGTSYTYNTDESIKRYFKTIAEMIDFIPAFKKISANQPETPPKVDSSDIIFTDKKGKEHTLTKEVQERWCETFNLKSLDESYTPKHSDEILQALGGKEIKLQLGSLKKLVAQGREKYIPQIKEVLDSPEAIMRDDMGEYLFIKHLKDDDYFVNVSFDNGEYLVSISNGIKETRNLNNKLEKGGSFIYQSPNFNSISQKLLQTSQYSANKIDSEILPQEAKQALEKPESSDLWVEFGANFAEYFSTPRSLANPRARNALRELYHASEKSQDNLALFDKVLEVAGKLKVKTQGKTTRDSAGVYYPAENRLTIRTHMPTRTIRMYGANITQGGAAISEEDIAQTLLHELIHSTISTAQLALTHKDFAPMAKALTQEQKHALEEIHTLYKLIKREHSHAKKWHTLPINDTYYYGLKNEREFIAELANPNFRDYLQRQNIFMRVINAVLKFFHKGKSKPTDTPTTALESLQNAYMKFLENFNYEHYINTRQETLKGVKDEIQARELESSYTYTTGEAKGIAELRKDLKAALEPSLNKEIVNKEQGLSGVITTEEVKKIMSSKAVAKSAANGFSRDEHIEVAKHIEKLFTESKLLRSHKDYKENPNILQVHRFVKDIEVNGKEANALITLFEKMQGKNKIYTIELESLENLHPLSTQAKSAGAAVKAQSAATTPTEAAPIAKTDKLV